MQDETRIEPEGVSTNADSIPIPNLVAETRVTEGAFPGLRTIRIVRSEKVHMEFVAPCSKCIGETVEQVNSVGRGDVVKDFEASHVVPILAGKHTGRKMGHALRTLGPRSGSGMRFSLRLRD